MLTYLVVHSLPPKQWLNLRKIILYEDRKSLLRPACHARGLIGFCKSNSSLRVEHNIGLLSNLLPESTDLGIDDRFILGSTCLGVTVPWIEEALSLAASGITTNAYRLIIDGSTTKAVQTFRLLKYAAAMQEAMLTQAERNNLQPTPWVRSGYGQVTSLPWHLPAGFPNVIRAIMNGTSNIQFTGPVGDLWDSDLMFFESQDWTIADWRNEWKEKIVLCGPETTFYEDTQKWYEL